MYILVYYAGYALWELLLLYCLFRCVLFMTRAVVKATMIYFGIIVLYWTVKVIL